MGLREHLVASWYQPRLTPLTLCLLPLSWLYGGAVAVRRALYRRGWLAAHRAPVPVIVVGNVTAGGTGKTPLVLALVEALAARGFRPGVVSRGYGGERASRGAAPLALTPQTPAHEAGDEPAVIARSGTPVAIGRDRAGAVRALLAAHPEIDLVVADDGLQHYALARDVEIAVLDAFRGIGNGHLLPAGPLREPARRLGTVDAIVQTEGMQGSEPDVSRTIAGVPLYAQALVPGAFRRVAAPRQTAAANALRAGRVHAIAGIGHPGRFFATLSALGIDATPHVFPDHHVYSRADLELRDADTILMTEKDAVKCEGIADARCWYLPVRAHVDPALLTLIEDKLRGSQAP
jgi:tetraacyldisaccharide 4'-kinase